MHGDPVLVEREQDRFGFDPGHTEAQEVRERPVPEALDARHHVTHGRGHRDQFAHRPALRFEIHRCARGAETDPGRHVLDAAAPGALLGAAEQQGRDP